jgi:ferredoxin
MMSRRSPYKPFTPKPEQIALRPAISGNTINGLNETAFRRPAPIYWHDPDTLDYGKLQKWFYTQDPNNPAINAARAARAKLLEMEVPPVTGEPLQKSPAEWMTALKAHVATLDMELFGVAAMNPDWIFEGYSIDERWVIMIGVAHDYERMRKAPDAEAGAEVVRQYGRGIKAAKDIAAWIRGQGWEAKAHGGPMAGPMVLIPPAIECGFGELGKHGSIINKEYGSSFRLACVLTDLPLQATPTERYGVDDFCSRCQVCADACPPEAIQPEKVPVRGATKWYVDFDKCLPFFNEHFGCSICISVCPWSIPGRGPRIVEQLRRRAARGKC